MLCVFAHNVQASLSNLIIHSAAVPLCGAFGNQGLNASLSFSISYKIVYLLKYIPHATLSNQSETGDGGARLAKLETLKIQSTRLLFLHANKANLTST